MIYTDSQADGYEAELAIDDNPDTIFSTRVETLYIAAKPGDALLMNGPWPELLLEYYRPPGFLEVYKVPE